MEYTITETDNITCVSFRGVLNAMDMIFMTQSVEFKQSIERHQKLLMDFTEIDGTDLNQQDVVALVMLGKASLQDSNHSHVAIATLNNDRDKISAICQQIFASTGTSVTTAENKQQALAYLNK